MDEHFNNKVYIPASEISVRQLVNVLSDAAFVCDLNGRVLECSEQVFPFFGLDEKAKVIGSNLQSYIAYDYIDEAYFLLLSVVNELSKRKSVKFTVRRGLKETFQADVTFSPVSGNNGSAKFILVTFRETQIPDQGIELIHKKDIRLSRLFESIISNSGKPVEKINSLLSQIGETLGAIACTYNRVEDGRVNQVASWESPFNLGIPAQLCSRQLYDYLIDHKEQLALIRKPLLSTFLESESLYRDDTGVKAILGFTVIKDNQIIGFFTVVFTINYSLSALDKQFIQTISSVLENDGTPETKSDTNTELAFRQLIDYFTDPVLIISPDALILDVNRGFTRCYGYENTELIGQDALIVSAEAEEKRELFLQMLDKALQGEAQKFDCMGLRKNGEIFPVELIFNVGKYYGRDVVIAISRDLTEPKKAEKELLKTNAELTESNKTKDKFFGILAHDLKNPFQGLLGFIDLLYEDLDELSNTQVKEYLSNVRTASYHTYALLENLLEWSRIQSGKMPFTPSFFNISDEINSVISILDNNATRKEIKLFNEVDTTLTVEADRNMIHSVLQNLITNSIKFSNANGKVVIRSRAPQTNSKSRSQTNIENRQWLEISVSDNGIGIPEEILPKLFKLNGQYSQSGTANEPGTGLGLVLCHEMVEKNGGRIWAESIAGQGTTFVFTLPLRN